MSWKPTGILFVAAAVLFAFIWWIERPIREARQRDASRLILPGLDPKAVTNVDVKFRGGTEVAAARLESGSNTWQLIHPLVYPAQGAPIMALLNALPALTWEQRLVPGDLKDIPDPQGKYGFANPLIEIEIHGPKISHKILVGQVSVSGDQVFLEVVGNPNIYIVGGAFVEVLPLTKDQWRDPSLFDLARLPYQVIQVRSPGKEFDLARNPTNNLWFMTNPVTARANSPYINQLLEQWQALRVRQFVTDDPKADLELYGLQSSPQTPDLDLSFWGGTNMAAELQVGSSQTNAPDYVFARRESPSNIVIIPRAPVTPWETGYSNFLDYHMISESPDQIGSIFVQGPHKEAEFSVRKGEDGIWQVWRGETNFPADASYMRDWLAGFTNTSTQVEKTVATDLSVYGLTPPLLEYTLRSAGAKRSIMAEIAFGTNASARIFEHRADEKSVNVMAEADFENLPRVAWQLRDRRIWAFATSNVVSLTIHQMGATRKFLRDPDGEWTFAPGFAGLPEVNWLKLEEGVERLGNLRAVYWDGEGEGQLQRFGFPDANFSLDVEIKRDGKAETLTIQFGGRSPYSYPYAAVRQDGQTRIFEFPVDLYDNFVDPVMTIPAALRYHP